AAAPARADGRGARGRAPPFASLPRASRLRAPGRPAENIFRGACGFALPFAPSQIERPTQAADGLREARMTIGRQATLAVVLLALSGAAVPAASEKNGEGRPARDARAAASRMNDFAASCGDPRAP